MAAITPPSGVSHIAICVRSLDQSLAFYRDLLGCEVVKDEMQDTRSGGLPHVYKDNHASRRVVHLRYGAGAAAPVLVRSQT